MRRAKLVEEVMELEEVVGAGWVNATDREPRVALAPAFTRTEINGRLRLGDRESARHVALMFLELITEKGLEDIASVVTGHLHRDHRGNLPRGLTGGLDYTALLNVIGIHLMRCVPWGPQLPKEVQKWYRSEMVSGYKYAPICFGCYQ